MSGKIARLFKIKTRAEAYLIIYVLAIGTVQRGSVYLHLFPGIGGVLLFFASTGAVFMAGAKILDCLRHERTLQQGLPLAQSRIEQGGALDTPG